MAEFRSMNKSYIAELRASLTPKASACASHPGKCTRIVWLVKTAVPLANGSKVAATAEAVARYAFSRGTYEPVAGADAQVDVLTVEKSRYLVSIHVPGTNFVDKIKAVSSWVLSACNFMGVIEEIQGLPLEMIGDSILFPWMSLVRLDPDLNQIMEDSGWDMDA